MQARYVQSGQVVDITAEADIHAGDIVVAGDLVAIAKADIRAGEYGALAATGTYDVVKGDGVAAAFEFGKPVYYDPAAKKCAAATAAGLVTLGKCVRASEAADATVRVLLNM